MIASTFLDHCAKPRAATGRPASRGTTQERVGRDAASLVLISLVLVCGLCVLQSGCETTSSARSPHRVWTNQNSPVQKRVEAARLLVPRGTRIDQAVKILGEPDERLRVHGPLLDIRDSSESRASNTTESYERWLMLYRFKDGVVLVQFERPTPTSRWREMTCVDISPSDGAEAQGNKLDPQNSK